MKKTVLITGIAGLIGSNFSDWIIKNKKHTKIIGIDDLSGGYIENIDKSIEFHKLNLVDDDIEYLFKENKIEIIFHFAAYAAEGLSPFIRVFNYNNNLLATAKLINNAIKYKIKRFVFTSSMATYGEGNAPFSEEDDLKPVDPYGIAKLACEFDLKVAHDQHGLEYCIIKPHNVYGPKQNIWDKYRNVLGIWMLQNLNNQPITIFGDGSQRRAFSYIEDCLEPLWNSSEKKEAKNQIVNLGGSKNVSLDEVADVLLEVMGYGEKIYLEKRHEVKNAWSTYEKSERLLGYNEKYTLRKGLNEMHIWAIKQPQRKQFKWENYEITDKIYSYWK